jgi:hypothetical protein
MGMSREEVDFAFLERKANMSRIREGNSSSGSTIIEWLLY